MKDSHTRYPTDRREFLRQFIRWGGIAFLSPILQACQRFGLFEETSTPTRLQIPTKRVSAETTASGAPDSWPSDTPLASDTASPSPTSPPTATTTTTIGPTATPAPGATSVALVKTTDRAEGVKRGIELLGLNPASGKRVFVKPNFNSRDPAPASTHIDVLRSTILKLQDMGASHITVGDRGGMGTATTVMKQKGGFELADQLGFDFIDFVRLEVEDWVMINPPDNHWTHQDSPLGPGFPFARPILQSDAIVSLCCLKTHQDAGITMSLKNTVGMVADIPGNTPHSYMLDLHESRNMDAMIAEINLAYEPALIVLDGVDAFIRGGPARGDLVHPGVILVGTDRIAIDALGATVLKMHRCNINKISQTFHIRNAIKLGIGVDSPEKIHIVTGDEESTRFSQRLHQYLMDNWD